MNLLHLPVAVRSHPERILRCVAVSGSAFQCPLIGRVVLTVESLRLSRRKHLGRTNSGPHPVVPGIGFEADGCCLHKNDG